MSYTPAEFLGQRLMANHLPVLLDEVIAAFQPRGRKRFLDATFGGGGHTRALLEAGPEVTVVSIDCDPEAAKRAALIGAEFGERLHFYDLNFKDLDAIGEIQFDGVLLDLGISSYHIESPERGFSFMRSGPTDMRFDPREGRPASEFLERADRRELARAVRDFGEERHWRRVVRSILEARGKGILSDTEKLAEMVAGATGWAGRRRFGIHPATRTFQGLRIYVNSELKNLKAGIAGAFTKLKRCGQLAIISFHSLEDRVVKRYFRHFAGLPEHAGDARPQQLREEKAVLVTPRPIRPSESEIGKNPRSRSARLRILRKTIE